MNLNTPEYWNNVWNKNRKADNPDYLNNLAEQSLSSDFWANAKSNPLKNHPYPLQKVCQTAVYWKVKSVLDVGCGNGRLLYALKRLLPDCRLFGVDLSDMGIERMKKEYGIDGSVIKIEELSSLQDKFDLVVISDVIEHVVDENKLLDDCRGLLTPYGHLFISFPNNILPPEETEEHLRTYTPHSAKSLMQRHFNKVSYETVGIHIFALASNLVYSQGDEEKIIFDYFGGRSGIFLDIGANDGWTLSNTAYLSQWGWQGVMVDASPSAFELLQKHYSGNDKVFLYRLALNDYDGEVKLYESDYIRLGRRRIKNVGLVSALDYSWCVPWKGKSNFRETRVFSKTFDSFYSRCPLKKFNFISIDIEGNDWKVLKQMDLGQLGCELLCIEYLTQNDIDRFINYCQKWNFREIGRTKTNILLGL